MRGISWLAANQLASQEGLCNMEWVYHLLGNWKRTTTTILILFIYFSPDFQIAFERNRLYSKLKYLEYTSHKNVEHCNWGDPFYIHCLVTKCLLRKRKSFEMLCLSYLIANQELLYTELWSKALFFFYGDMTGMSYVHCLLIYLFTVL